MCFFETKTPKILWKMKKRLLISRKVSLMKVLKNVVFRFRSIQIFCFLLLPMCVIFAQKKVVIIDVGHGGTDTGAIGVNGIQEKDIVLSIAKQIVQLNKTLFNNELAIYLTRYTDTLISLSDRTLLAKTLKANVFISLHCNASPKASKGMEVFVHNSDNQFTKSSIGLGLDILNQGTQKLGFKQRGVKFANFQVLRDLRNTCPAVLVEFGFVTNVDEVNYFTDIANLRALGLVVISSVK